MFVIGHVFVTALKMVDGIRFPGEKFEVACIKLGQLRYRNITKEAKEQLETGESTGYLAQRSAVLIHPLCSYSQVMVIFVGESIHILYHAAFVR